MNQKIWENSNKLLALNAEHEFLWKFQKTDIRTIIMKGSFHQSMAKRLTLWAYQKFLQKWTMQKLYSGRPKTGRPKTDTFLKILVILKKYMVHVRVTSYTRVNSWESTANNKFEGRSIMMKSLKPFIIYQGHTPNDSSSA